MVIFLYYKFVGCREIVDLLFVLVWMPCGIVCMFCIPLRSFDSIIRCWAILLQT